MSELSENGGELTPELEATLMALETLVPEKVDSYIGFMERLEHEEIFWAEKAKFYQRMEKSCKAIRDNLKNRAMFVLEAEGLREIAGNDVKIKLVDTQAVEVTNEALLPADYVKEEVVKKVDKKKIAQDIKAGKTVAGAYLRPSTYVKILANRRS